MLESVRPPCPPVNAATIGQAHQLYCQWTGQSVRLGFDRERMWYELLRQGYGLEDLRAVLAYLQREIQAGRRNVGALKLSNLLQPDRFEEDLQISRVRLRPPPRPKTPPPTTNPHKTPPRPKPAPPSRPALSAAEQEAGRQRALKYCRQIRAALR
jgi:hypothetical protein